jgi:hypothetical protein
LLSLTHTRPRFGVGSGCFHAQVLIPRLAVVTGYPVSPLQGKVTNAQHP